MAFSPSPTPGNDTITSDGTDGFVDALGGHDTVLGGNGLDTILGSTGHDELSGAVGADSLDGGDDNDTLAGGAGADVLIGGAGNDTADYSASPRATLGSSLRVSLFTGLGSGPGSDADGDTLSGIENLIGSAFDDRLEGDANANRIEGGLGGDRLIGLGGNDILLGGDGADLISGGAGADLLDGGADDGPPNGLDLLDYRTSSAGVRINLTANTASGGDAEGDVISGFEGVYGSNFGDELTGTLGSDQFVAGSGDDTIRPVGGFDFISDIGGVDTVFYDTAGGSVVIDLQQGIYTVNGAFSGFLNDIENLVGSAFDDSLTGEDSVANLLDGGAGADTLVGGGGNDTLIGGVGSDRLDGGAGIDTASYATSSGRVTAALSIQPPTDNDALHDTLIGIENLTGSDFNDQLDGDAVANILDGGAGNDALYGQGGADTLIGGTGRDTVYYDIANTAGITVNLTLGTGLGGQAEGDVLIGVENVVGSAFADRLIGDANANILNGEAGEDTLIGGAGADTLQGNTTLSGADVDTVDYSASFAAVTVSLLTGTGSAGDAEGDVLIVIENLVGSGFNDVLIGAAGANSLLGGTGDDLLIGGSGADVLDGGFGPDTVSYITSTTGVRVELATGLGQSGDAQGDILRNIERVSGSDFGDTFTGGAAGDVLLGLLGDDLLAGGDGDDFLVGGGGADRLDGGSGLDTASYATSTMAVLVDLTTGLGSGGEATGDTLVGVERVFGSQFGDTLIGGASSDVLLGDLGADLLRGGGGADVLVGGAGFDTADYLTSGAGVAALLGGGTAAGGDAEGDVLLEVEGLIGSAFNDVLVGDAGSNVLIGGAGNDYVLGRGGADVLVGGSGTDRFVFAVLTDSTPGPGVDLIADFSRGEGDLFDFSPLLGGLNYRFIANAGFSGTGPELRSEAIGGGRFLVETDAGEGTADLRIVVQTVDVSGNLVASDFVF
ncbi:beta strand repeat-containing protein [Muricoccus radiodurans]|uniref:beta strand repeat-containing protein n=1 Tax=Muricoccus radiodurans TaxID=2231721 RepID=UPI003CFABBA8